MNTLDNFTQHNNTIENQLRKHFIDLRQEDDWQVVKVYRCEDEQHKRLEHYTNYYGTYVIETLAVRDINGYNKHGAYNRSVEGDIIQDFVIVLTDGKVIHECIKLVAAQKEMQESTALTVHGSASVSYTGYTEIACKGSQN